MQKKRVVLHIRPDKKPFPMEQGLVKDGQQVGQALKVFAAPPVQWIPNTSQAYVIKILENGKYNGNFKFTDPDEAGAEPIEVRWLENCPSLDKQWQSDNKREPKTDAEEIGWPYKSGEKVEYTVTASNKKFIEFLLNHESCGTNVNRLEGIPSLFVEVDEELELRTKQEALQEKKEALKREEEAIKEELAKLETLSEPKKIKQDIK